MKSFSNSIALATAVLIGITTSTTFADSTTCHYFYNPIVGIAPIEAHSPNYSNNPVLTILKDVLANHFNIRKITPDMTIQSFENYLDLVDPLQIFISKEDLKKLKYPEKSFFENLHLAWLNEHTRPEYMALFSRARTRMDAYINRFVNNSAFRSQILDRANEIQDLENWNYPDQRPQRTADIEAKLVDHLASALIYSVKVANNGEKRKIRNTDLADLIRRLRIDIETHKENVSEEAFAALITKSFLNTFDAHTAMYLPEETRLSLDGSKAKRTSVGIISSPNRNGMRITDVALGSVGEKAGLLANDIVVAVEPVANSRAWFATRRLTLSEYAALLVGEPDTNFRMRILRDSKELTLEITRQMTTSGERTVRPAEIRSTPSGSIMSIQLTAFSAGSSIALKKEIARNKTADVKGLILDLRGNLGGSVVEMSNIVQLFAGRVTSMLVRDRNSVSVERSDINGATIWDGPLVILVDHSSASSSEALAAALQAHKRAIIIGGPLSYGKGSMQAYKQVNNTMYKYTAALFYSPTGVPLQWNGVKVDIPLVSTNSASNPFLERVHENSIRPTPLGGPASSISYKIPNLDAINAVLVEKSKSRGLIDRAEGKSIQEIFTQNTDEAYRIVEDWLQIENKTKR